MLKVNTTLTDIKYATMRACRFMLAFLAKCQQPLTPNPACVRSLRNNQLDAEAAKYLSEGLKENTALKELKYAATHLDPYCQQPLTHRSCSCLQFER